MNDAWKTEVAKTYVQCGLDEKIGARVRVAFATNLMQAAAWR